MLCDRMHAYKCSINPIILVCGRANHSFTIGLLLFWLSIEMSALILFHYSIEKLIYIFFYVGSLMCEETHMWTEHL